MDITSVQARTLSATRTSEAQSDEPETVGEELESPSRSRRRPREAEAPTGELDRRGVSSRRPDRPTGAPPASKLAARLACRSRIELSAIGSVYVVVKVPVAAVQCDRNAGAEGGSRRMPWEPAPVDSARPDVGRWRRPAV